MGQPRGMNLLIVEDDSDFRETCARWMTRKGHSVTPASNGAEALDFCERRTFDVAIVDMNMPGLTGLQVLERIKASQVETEVIILTGQGTIENAVQAMKLGACDYLTKPFPLDELEQRCLMAWERGRLSRENRQLKALIARSQGETVIVGSSPQMQQIFRLVSRVAPTDKPVLIQGESGTGKELVARLIQQQSTRASRPFVTINCAALPEQLVEAELFGVRKGAFTGAHEDRTGLFEVADGGTLFIDEIGELPGGLQPKLLRALEDGSIRRVGSNREHRVDVRLIAATNRRLSDEVAAGRFREDLYYRINVMALELPPLRERVGDIHPLVTHILGAGWSVAPDAMQALERFPWPGNVRQLRNVLERGRILAENDMITMADLPSEVRRCGDGGGSSAICVRPAPAAAAAESPVASIPGGLPPLNGVHASVKLEDLQRNHVLEILKQQNGNKARAAKVLGIHRRKLYRLLERYGERAGTAAGN